MANRTQALLVEDDARLAALVAEFLGKHEVDVTVAADGERGLRALRDKAWDVVLLDLMLPGVDGLEIARRMRADPRTAQLPVIMLTAKGDDVDKIVGLELGADDYVTKPFDLRELLARIKSVLRRSEGSSREPGEVDTLHFAGFELRLKEHRLCDSSGAEIALTHGEFKLLAALARNAQKTLSRDEILDLTHGREAGPYDRTVDMQITRLRRKLGEDPRLPSVIRSVRGVGYMLACPVES